MSTTSIDLALIGHTTMTNQDTKPAGLDLFLRRTYYPTATNGAIYLPADLAQVRNDCPGGLICHSIELAWKNNQRKVSCIPEGRYKLTSYKSPKHGMVLLINDVPGRSMCEIHEANWANGQDGKHPQLEGCIAPVSVLEPGKPGVGWRSGNACDKLEGIAFEYFKYDLPVWLNIVKA